MVSFEHELLVAIIREHPELVLALLRVAFDVSLEGELEVLDRSENLTVLQPAELRADAVLVMHEPGRTEAVRAFVVEVQLHRDERKRRSWPAYVTAMHARHRCPVNLVVITTDAAVARWCAQPIAYDEQGSCLRPRVVGPAAVPAVDDDTLAGRHPELAVVSLLAHRNEPAALDIGRALLSACRSLDRERAELYADIVFDYLNAAARRALEAEMLIPNYQPRSEFMRNLKALAIAEGRAEGRAEGIVEGRAEGIAEGRAEGIAEGRAEGIAEGRAEGEVEALARAVMRVLEMRGLAIDDAQRGSITGCRDAATLELWLERAVTAGAVGDVLGR